MADCIGSGCIAVCHSSVVVVVVVRILVIVVVHHNYHILHQLDMALDQLIADRMGSVRIYMTLSIEDLPRLSFVFV